jgi:hypothetical protein
MVAQGGPTRQRCAGSVSIRVCKIVGAFVRLDCFDQRANVPPAIVDCPLLCIAHPIHDIEVAE